MDKRILLIIAICNAAAISIFFFKRASAAHAAPAPHFVIDKDQIYVGDSVTFTDDTKGATNWNWDFGDKEPSFKKTGTHTFLDIGKHRVRVTISGPSFGPLVDSSKEILVLAAAPKIPVDTAKPVVEAPKPKAPAPEASHKPHPHPHSGGGDDALPTDSGPTEIKH
jgi:PKD repeat protein